MISNKYQPYEIIETIRETPKAVLVRFQLGDWMPCEMWVPKKCIKDKKVSEWFINKNLKFC